MSRRTRLSCALAALLSLISSLFIALATPASANQVFATDCGANDFVEEFGRNQSVCVTGDVDTIWGHEILPSGDVYVVRNAVWSGGETLVDVSAGGKNRVIGAGLGGSFFDEPVWLAPLTPGEYDLVIDEGRDGVYDPAEDYVLDPGPEPAFRVLGADLAGYTLDVAAVKADAAEQRDRYRNISRGYTAARVVSSAGTAYSWGSAISNAGGSWKIWIPVSFGIGIVDFQYWPLDYNSAVITLGSKFVYATSAVAREHWDDLHRDPADPNFWMPVGVDLDPVRASLAAEGLGTDYPTPVRGTDPLEARLAATADRMAEQSAVVHALMHAHEKFLGARDADDLAWSVAHAEELAGYATLLEDTIADTKAAMLALRAEIATRPGADDPIDVAGIAAIQARLATSGFTAAEREQASDLGFDDAALERLRTELLAMELPETDRSLVGLLDDAVATGDAAVPAIQQLGADAAALAGRLTAEVEPVARPFALAGGPYTGTPGTPVALDASESTGAATYDWDTDLDGVFDDASGAATTVTPARTGRMLVGLRVTNADGAADTAYAEISVTGGNRAPVVSASAPASPATVAPGTTRAFSVDATDPDGDAVTVRWTLDGVEVGTGATYTYAPGEADMGAHVLVATVTDDAPYSGDSGAVWQLAVVPPDGDGDGWRAHVDCDDTDPAVNPGATEVIGNGVDDDCRAATSDDGEPPVAGFTAPARSVDVAHQSTGATVTASSVRSTSTTYRPQNVLDDSVGTAWTSALGQTHDQTLRIALGEGGEVVDRVTLRGSTLATGAKTVEVRTSLDGVTFTPSETVVVPRTSTGIDEPIAPVRARWVELLIRDNHGDPSYLTLADARVWTRGRTGGFVSLAEGPPARVVAVSSELSSTTPGSAALVEAGNWRSNGRTNQSLTVELGGAKTYPVDRVRLQSSSTTEAAKSFTVAVSDTNTDPASFHTVLTAVGASTTASQEFTFPATTAKYVRLSVADNHGSTCCIRVNRFEVLTPDGLNAANGDGVGAAVLTATTGGGTASRAIDYDDTSYWETASGSVTNQAITVRLLDGGPHEVDRVRINGISGSRSPKSVAVSVSDTGLADADFTTVDETVLPSDGLDHWLVFPKRQAKYVRLLVKDGYGSTTVRVRSFQVFSPQWGGPTVPFDDLSTDPEGRPLESAWDFGDGTTSSEKHPVHTYDDPGTYPVSLTVRDTEDLLNTSTSSYRNVAPPQTDFAVPGGTIGEGATVTFSDGSYDAAVGLVGWEWDFGFATVTTRNASVAFADNGTYGATLTATNGQEVRSSATKQVTVVNLPPTLSLSSTVSLFTLQQWNPTPSVSDPSTVDRTSLVCDWNFGDGTTQHVAPCSTTTARVPHTYDLPGTYTAKLAVTDKDGGRVERTVVATVVKRDTVLSNVRTSYAAGGISVTARLYERTDLTPVANVPLTFSLLGATVTATTAADGFATVLLPVTAAATDVVAIAFAGDARHNATTASRPVRAPLGDVIFAVDESGSMGGAISGVQNSITDVALSLGASVDYRLGLVGFGASALGGAPRIHSTLTDDLGTYLTALGVLETSGGFEPGFAATVKSLAPEMQPRANAGTCVVLVTDEDADIGPEAPTTKQQAIDALLARNAVFFGIVGTGGTSASDYGPSAGSLAAATGGSVFSISSFTSNPKPVVDAIVERCVDEIRTADLVLTKTDGVTEVEAGDEVEYTLTVSNAVDQPATGVELVDRLPAGLTFVSASDGGTLAADGSVHWPAFTLPANAAATRTVRVGVGSGLSPGAALANTATVSDDGAHGPDLDPSDNTATDTDSYVVSNVAPVVDAGADATVDEGSAFHLAATVTDADADDAHEVTVDWGDGSSGPAATDATHVYDDDGTYEVRVTATDTFGHTATDTVVVTVRNVAPVVSLPARVEVDEGGAVTLDGSFADPGAADTWTASDGEGPVTLNGTTFTVSRSYVENGASSVEVCVTDDDGGTGCATTEIVVRNVAPEVTATGSSATEGSVATVTAAYRDLGRADSHTAEVEWGDGSPVETVPVLAAGDGRGSLAAGHAYGDEGDYTVSVTVTDDDGGATTATATVAVSNLGPSVTLDTTDARTFAGGLALVTSAPSPLTFTAYGTDPGADTLTFTWATGGTARYEADGTFPVSAADTTTASFPAGVGLQTVDLSDGDGGTARASLPVLVTGTSDCTFTQGFWRRQFAATGSTQVPREATARYLGLVGFGSRVFSELVPASTPGEARAVFTTSSSTMRHHATEQLLAAWLNFAHGGVGLDEKVDTNMDGVPDLTFAQIVESAEETLLDPAASHDRLERAKSLAEAVNLHAHDC